MDLELLRTFLEVYRTRHFGQAAEVLHLTQAAVSARIKHLESLLGVKLFDRLRRDIRLTPEGNRLLVYAERLIAQWRKARQDVTLGGANQQLVIGGSNSLWDVLLQDWLHRLHREKPDLAIIAESHTPEVLTRRLLDGVLDIAFMLEPAQLEVLQIKKIALINLMMVSTSAGTNAEQALARDYLMVDWGLAHGVRHRRLFPDAPEPQIRVGQAKMAHAYLLEIGGSAYLPTRMVLSELESGLLHVVQDAPTIDWHAYAVYPLRSSRIELIRQALKLFEYRVEFEMPSDE